MSFRKRRDEDQDQQANQERRIRQEQAARTADAYRASYLGDLPPDLVRDLHSSPPGSVQWFDAQQSASDYRCANTYLRRVLGHLVFDYRRRLEATAPMHKIPPHLVDSDRALRHAALAYNLLKWVRSGARPGHEEPLLVDPPFSVPALEAAVHEQADKHLWSAHVADALALIARPAQNEAGPTP